MVFRVISFFFRSESVGFFFQVCSIGPLKRFWGVAMSDFDLTHLSIHPARELKRAYQELVLKFHPDKTGGKECEAFINVQVSDLETSMMDIITKRPKREFCTLVMFMDRVH